MAEEKKPATPKAAAEKKPVAEKAAEPKAAAAPKAATPKAAAAPKAAAPKAAEPKVAASQVVEKPAAAPKTTAAKAAAKPAASKTAADKTEKSAKVQILKLHHLRPAAGAKKEKTRKGLGEGSKGKTAGRGTKGSKARTTVRVGFEGGGVNLVMRTPKLRGFKNPFRVEYQVVNLERLAEMYPKGGSVTISDLVSRGAVRKGEPVKVLGNGDISVKLEVTVDKVSRSAQAKIEAAGGSVKA